MARQRAKKKTQSLDVEPPEKPADPPFTHEALDPLDVQLDPQNPRLPPKDRGKTQERILEIMLDRFAINEVAESICSAGFLPIDPFIGYRDTQISSATILEGNRRLATIKLLLDPALVPERYEKVWNAFRARVAPGSLAAMKSISVAVYRDRNHPALLAYIGYRHVNGIMSWDAEEKADFVARLVDDKAIGWTYESIARKLGSKPAYVERLYVAHRLIEQAKVEEIPGHEKMRRQFGVLTRALQSPLISAFLGVSYPRDPAKSERPATAPKEDLLDFVRWTFGTEDEEPLTTDSRNLTKLGKIYSSTEALRYLRKNKDPRFERAFAKSGGLVEGIVDSLSTAADYLADAVPLVRQHKDEEDVERGVEKCTDFVVQMLQYFPEVARRQKVEIRSAITS